MNPFENKIAVVTGGAGGLGRGICEELGRRGALVVVTDVNAGGAEAVAAGIVRRGGRARAARLDVSREDEVRKVVDDTVAAEGRIDYMFNNAGVAMRCEVQDMTFAHWHRIVDIDLMGVIYGTNAAYAHMVRRGAGHIVNISSVAGLTGFPTAAAYAATKAAVVGLSVSLRVEGEALGVKVSVVCPGYIKTEIFDEAVKINEFREEPVAGEAVKMGLDKAVAALLDGVARNRAIIVFPWRARILWWLNRLNPMILAPLGRRAVRDFRAAKK